YPMMRLRRLAGVIVLVCLIWAAPAHADVVADWNAITTQTAVLVRPGPTSILDLAMVHAAMHDAIQAYDRRYEPYVVDIRHASGSPVAAAASAAHDVLVAQFPEQAATFDGLLNDYLGARGLLGDSGVGVAKWPQRLSSTCAWVTAASLQIRRSSLAARIRANGVRPFRPLRLWYHPG